jgi:putative redox protein
MAHAVERVEFTGSSGDTLVGRLQRPVGPRVGVALFAHCFTCSKDLHAARNITLALADQGFATLRFDFTGLGQSGGDFADTTFSHNVDDLVAAARWLEEHLAPPSLLVGHSLGGSAVYCAAHELPSVRAVASVAAPADPAHVERQFGDQAEVIRADGEAVVELAGRPFRVKRAFLDDLRHHRLAERIAQLRRAVLVLHSPVDASVGVENAREIFEAAHHPKSFVSLDGADHLLTDAEDARYAGSVIATWARRYAAEERRVDVDHHDDVEVTTGDRLLTDVVVRGRHRLHADEPTDLGGDDAGPTPYELIGGGLGACTGMTLRLYADRKGLDLAEVRVHLRHEKRMEDGEKVDVWRRMIELEGDLTAAERNRLLQIADRCPVHRTLHEGRVRIETVLG